jgi:alpha-1,2-mannosyltransferase/arabinofuranan 3-O-arabinosyltransferase
LVTLWLVQTYGSINYVRMVSPDVVWHQDFLTFYRSAVALLRGQSIYATGDATLNLNPPFMTVLFAPFGVFDPMKSWRILSVATVVVLLASLALVARELRFSPWLTGLAAALMLVSTPLMGTIGLGQIYAGLTLGLTLAWVAARRGSLVWAGVFLGLVIAVKPTLIPLLLLPIAQRHRSMLFSAIATGTVASLIGLIAAGPTATWDWLKLMRTVQVTDYYENASLPGFVMRLGGPVWLGFVLGGVILVITFLRIRRNSDLALWALTAATLLLSPVSWENYLLLCYPGVVVLLSQRRYSTSALLLVVPTITLEWVRLWMGHSPTVAHLGWSLFCYVQVIWWAGLLPTSVARNQAKDQADEPQPADEPGETKVVQPNQSSTVSVVSPFIGLRLG